MKKRIYIYHIYFPTSNKSYIGQTHNIKIRMSAHFCSKYLVGRALRKYDDWEIYILYTTMDKDTANLLEIEGIRNNNSILPCGYNLTKGGGGSADTWANCPNKEERKEKFRQSYSGRNHPMYGKHLSKETKRRISQAKLGHKYSEKARAKMSLAKKGNKNALGHKYICSQATKAKIVIANTGRKCSEETKSKISAACMGRTFSTEHRARLSAAMLGHPSTTAKLTKESVKEIRFLYQAKTLNQVQLADKFGVSRRLISDVINLRKWV